MSPTTPEWLSRYGNRHAYRWRPQRRKNLPNHHRNDGGDRVAYCRPLGLVEFNFDADGRYFEGRADMNVHLEVSMRSTLRGHDLRERILVAFALVRCRHLLLRARTVRLDEDDDDDGGGSAIAVAPRGLHFAVDVYESVGRAIEDAGNHLVFLEDYYGGGVEGEDFYAHCLNVGRVVDADVALTRCFVLPREEKGDGDDEGTGVLRFLFVIAHQTCDGLSSCIWMREFLKALNEPEHVLREQIKQHIRPEVMEEHLPLPQEALYPPIPGSRARVRWFWLLVRILRHVRKPLPIGFDNPLQRGRPRTTGIPLSPTYDRVLQYRAPHLNSYSVQVKISPASTQRLHKLCKAVHASLGAGIYALAGMVAMEFHEERHPGVQLHERKHFITGFPLDPRAFLGFHTDPDSMMLAFSDGIALPFLPSRLSVEGRLRLLARQAQRQLASYQKRARPTGEDAKRQYLTSRGAGLVLANQYLLSLEMADSRVPGQRSIGLDAQGEYPARKNPTVQTHGVSSVGNRDGLIRGGIYDLSNSARDFAADFLELRQSVRPREGEFLVGIGGGSDGGLFCTPSIDITNLDPVLVDRWRDRFETALDMLTDSSDGPKL